MLWVAPYLAAYYPWSPAFAGSFVSDRWYYDRYRPVFRRVELPTGDMVPKALPEGVVDPGGRASGFLYFEEVGDVERADFIARLVDASTGARLGSVSIAFLAD
jgi:hypothetical protein